MTLLKTHKSHNHKVLIVGTLEDKTEAVGPLLKEMGLNFLNEKTAEDGLKRIETARSPFALVICDQRMPGMKGTEFLARVKEMSPDTIRILVTGYSQMDAIIAAVNKGAVQHYVSKPWDPEKLVQVIEAGISHHEYHLDSNQLFALAKQQNAKLYELNCELMEITKRHEQNSQTLDKYITSIRNQLREKTGRRPLTTEQIQKGIIRLLNDGDTPPQEEFDTLYEKTIQALYAAFTELALRNGIEMPEPSAGEDR